MAELLIRPIRDANLFCREFVDHSSVILKEVQHVYDEMEIFSDYFVGLDADEVTSDVLSELKEDLSNIMAPFKEVDRKIDIQLGIPDDLTDGKSKVSKDVNEGGEKDIEEEEYES